ncbi:RHS repeat-associated core domain-containing protein, partial [Vibrio parahaemolyticus]
GNIVWSASYDVHGFASIDVEEVRNPLRFQGQYFDQETNLHYNLARYYDPKLGRFIQQDPISIAGGINHYQYAVNPIQWIDPTGFLCEEGLKRLQKMLAEYQAQNNVPQEVCDQILEAAKESSVGEDGVRSQVKIRKPKGKNHIRYEYDLDHIDCERNEITFYRHINHSDGSRHEVQYVVGIEEFVLLHPRKESRVTYVFGQYESAKFGESTTINYRKTFFEANPLTEGKVVVHHAVEQQVCERYPGIIKESEMHSLENLRGIPKEVNSKLHLSKIRKEWDKFYRQNPNPNKQQLLNKATEIDDMFGAQFNPPIR